MFLQQLVNGLVIGGIYAMIAVGYTMIYGVIQLINFAHGEIYMLGAFFAITFISFSNYLTNYSAATNLPSLTSLTKAGLEQSPFLSK